MATFDGDDRKMSINALELSDFAIESVYHIDALKICEGADDEMVVYNDDEISSYKNDERKKRQLSPKEKVDINERPLKKICNGPTIPAPIDKPWNKRRKKEKAEEEIWKKNGHLPRTSTKRKYIGNSQEWKTSSTLTKFHIKFGGYTSMPSSIKNTPEIESLENAIALGFVIVKSNSFHQPITDRLGRIIAVSSPPPNDPSYHESTKRAFERMEKEATLVEFKRKDFKQTRGDFIALNIGLSYGNGHTKPTCPDMGRYDDLAKALLGDVDIQRLASYQDATYALWHPKAYRYYKTNLDKLWKEYPHLAHPLFPRSIMPAVAFNLGKRVVTRKHVDSQNCPFGWCIITALGKFDATKGGHLVLWELGLILEFPAGACICLPSALITHSNIPTGEDESRMSFTQYCSGEIFRYIENGFTTDKNLRRDDSAILLFRENARKTRIQEGLAMFSTIQELLGVSYQTNKSPQTNSNSIWRPESKASHDEIG